MVELPGTRVVIVTPSLLTRGGTEVYLRRLARVQRGLGLAVRYFTQDAPGSVTEFEGFPVEACGEVLSEAMSPVSWFQRANGVARLADRIAESADWVELHRLAPLDLMRALKGRVRQLLFLHTPELTCPALGRFLPRSGKLCDRTPGVMCIGVHAMEGCMSKPDGTAFPVQQRLRAFTRGPVTRALAAIADRVVFNSASMRDLFLATTGAAVRSTVLHPPLLLHSASSARVPNRLLFVGRLSRPKGARDAVLAAALIPGSELHIHGDGQDRPSLEILAHQHGVHTVFHGHSDDAALARAYAGASCLLVPSRWYEAWGMVGPEAIASGCPVAAYDCGGIREWLGLEYGRAVPVGDVRALAQAAQTQMARAIDAARWRADAEARWGIAAFERGYLATHAVPAHAPDVLQIQRRPGAGHHSMEVLFEQTRAALPAGVSARVAVCPHPSQGLIPRLRSLLWARSLRADVFHIVGDVHYLALALQGGRTVLTVHDCGVLRGKSGLRRWLLRKLWFAWPVRRAAEVTTISEFSRDELAAVAGIAPDRIAVIPNCAGQAFTPGAEQRSSKPLVLLVGTAANKNLLRVLPALQGLNALVVVIGRPDAEQARLLKHLDHEVLHDLDVSSMAALYRRAWLLVFASTYEGFGMPIIEAQACGTPVVTSSRAPMDEVAGGAALLVQPEDTAAIREAVARLLNDAGLREELIAKGLVNASRFSAIATAAAYADVYRRVLQNAGREG
ncbi:MAG: glycosyltransferase [Planctomycetes bacterium]|nr:glycosyltransferase [Planctomycetota bacterium]